jgi:hypothetical protein
MATDHVLNFSDGSVVANALSVSLSAGVTPTVGPSFNVPLSAPVKTSEPEVFDAALAVVATGPVVESAKKVTTPTHSRIARGAPNLLILLEFCMVLLSCSGAVAANLHSQ